MMMIGWRFVMSELPRLRNPLEQLSLKKKRKSTAFCQRCSDFAAGWGQIRRDESGRKLESLRIKSNQLNPLQHKSHPPETRCSRRETSLAFSTSPLHSIPPSLFCHPFPTKPELPPAPQSNTNQSCCCCPVSCPTAAAAASLPLLPQSNQLSAAMSAPVVDADYMAEIERARRDLRALISSKNCAPIILRLAYVLITNMCGVVWSDLLVTSSCWTSNGSFFDVADGMMLALTTPRPTPEAPMGP